MLKIKSEQGILLGVRRFGEHKMIADVFTAEFGRFCGLMNAKIPPVMGSQGTVRWQARLAEGLGLLVWETQKSIYPFLWDNCQKLYALTTVCQLLAQVLPERQSYPQLWQASAQCLHNLYTDDFLRTYVLWEKTLLGAIGFGLDLSRCVAGGDSKTLAFISPKSGGAVSREKGQPFADKLLPLPVFLWDKTAPASAADLKQAMFLTGFFLEKSGLLKKMPLERQKLYDSL